MTESSRTQGLLICGGSALAGVIFLVGLLTKSWWAVALPVGALLAFGLGLTFWVGWTIATVQVEPEPDADAASSVPPAPTSGDSSR
jgi:hypothetical protein